MNAVKNFVNKLLLVINIMNEGGVDMLVMLFVAKITLGSLTFAEVPAKLKPAVRNALVELGVPELAEEGQ